MTALWPAPTASGPVHARVRLPGSKSLTNRALVLAALADGPGVVRGALRSRDTLLMAEALTRLGASVDTSSEDWTVVPGEVGEDVAIDCGLAGTVMRFVPPVAALSRGRVRFDGDPHARSRPMAAVLGGLRDLGVQIEDEGRGSLPFDVLGRGRVAGGEVVLDASASSQFVSALLLAAPAYDAGVVVRHVGPPVPSQPHLDMTVAALRERGVEVDDSEADVWRVLPGPVRAVDTVIEPDLSNAGPFVAAAAATGGEVHVAGWPASTTQAGDRLRGILEAMGAQVSRDPDGLVVRGASLHGIDLDMRDIGELAPVVAALASLADSPTRLRGLAHIRGHETDRLAALHRELTGLGGRVRELPDGLDLDPATLHGGRFETYADHRMAHAGSLLGLVVPGVEVVDVATTAKTFPGFAEAWQAMVEGHA